jgi:4-oxalomesaconate tautomerase
MRGGTSKGAYFLRDDLPAAPFERDEMLLRIMGTPDPRQIDGIGGAHPLTSKVAVVGPPTRSDADVDYLFLKVGVADAMVTDAQNCGNLLAGIGPFALERGLLRVPVDVTEASVRIHMLNGGSVAVATFPVERGAPVYEGDTAIAGVPGTAARIRLDFESTAGSTCGSLLPTGNVTDAVDGVEVTCIDNGMPVVVMRAADLGVTGYESCAELESDPHLRRRLETIRLAAGPRMGLGDVAPSTVPKLTMVAAPQAGGHLCTRTFIPHRCHDGEVVVEHPTGTFDVSLDVDLRGDVPIVRRAGIVRTARPLFDGVVFPRPSGHATAD